MPGLNIIVAAAEGRRFCTALETAVAAAALGQARLFVQGDAAAMLRAPAGFAGDGARRAGGAAGAGRTDRRKALASGVEIVVCQSGLALSDLTATGSSGGVKAGGVVSFWPRRRRIG